MRTGPIVSVLLAAAMAACTPRAAQRAAPPPVAPTRAAPQPAAPTPAPEVELVEEGAAPRRPLEHAFAPGLAETLVLELAGSLTLAVGDLNPPEVKTPPLRLTVRVEVRAADGGRAALVGTVDRVEVVAGDAAPALVAAVKSDLEGLQGTPFTGQVNTRGVVWDVAVVAPGNANPQLASARDRLRRAIEVMIPAVPAQPVGRGARWQVRRPGALGPVRLEETLQYTLAEASGGRLRLAVKVSQSAAEQPVAPPGLPAGASVTLNSLSAAGGGKAEVHLGKLVHPMELRWTTTGAGVAETPDGRANVTLSSTGSLAVRRAR